VTKLAGLFTFLVFSYFRETSYVLSKCCTSVGSGSIYTSSGKSKKILITVFVLLLQLSLSLSHTHIWLVPRWTSWVNFAVQCAMQMPVLAPDTPSELTNGMDWIRIMLLEFEFRATLRPKREKGTGLPVICVHQNKICETLLANGDYVGQKAWSMHLHNSQSSMCCV
jgi:hypothetical protein